MSIINYEKNTISIKKKIIIFYTFSYKTEYKNHKNNYISNKLYKKDNSLWKNNNKLYFIKIYLLKKILL